jgi:hypothetical protein
MAILPRSQIIQPNDTVSLAAKFAVDGNPIDLDTFPQVSIIQPSGGVVIAPTSLGVMRIGTGEYQFNYNVGLYPPIGTWRDVWQGVYQGYSLIGEYSFTTFNSQLPGVNTDGQPKLGDDPGFNFSPTAICNINKILKLLRARLKARGKARRIDENGNPVYKDCDIYTVDELVSFICSALSDFNMIPHFTFFTYDDTPIIEQFCEIFVQGALYLALGAQSLIERGREFQVSDNGIGFTPPTVSELLNSQYAKELDQWYDKCKLIKVNMRSSPLGLSSMSYTSGASPQFRRLRTFRARQIY